MKRFYFFLLFACAVLSAQSQNVAINDDGSAPDPSAMLHVNVFGVAKRGFLVPRMNTADRTAIASPANGLLVYDLSLNRFMVFSGGLWREIVQSNNSLWANDGSQTSNTIRQPVNITNGSFTTEGQLNVFKLTGTITGKETIMTIMRETSGTSANGIAGSIMFRNQLDNGGMAAATRLSAIAETVLPGNNKQGFQIETYNSGSPFTSMYMNPDGVSIGSALSPQSRLHVFSDGSITGGLRISATNGATNGASLYLEGASKNWAIMASNAGDPAGTNKLLLRDNSLDLNRLVIDGLGNIGLGTDNPGGTNKLDVAGNINFTGTLKVNNSTGTTGDVLMSNGASSPQWQNLRQDCRAYLSGNFTLPPGGFTTLTGFNELYDDGGSFNNTTGEYVVPATGLYTVSIHLLFTAAPAISNLPVQIRILLNGGTFTADQTTGFITTNGAYGEGMQLIITAKFSASDKITFAVLHADGASHDLQGGGASSSTFISIHREY